MSSLPPPELLTPRLLLRLVQEADLTDLLAVHADEEVNRYLPYVTWRGMADAQAWYAKVLQRRREGSAMQFVLQQQAGGRVIGGCLLFRFEPESGLAELGYALGRRDWGEGGAEFHWWCTEAPEAFSGREPVYKTSRDEIVELVGEPIYDLMVEQLERPNWTPLPHPVVRR